MRNSNWTVCGLSRHFGQHHREDMEVAISALQVVIVDSCDREEELKQTEDRWMCNLGTLFVGLNSHNEVLSNNRRNFGAAWWDPQCPHFLLHSGGVFNKTNYAFFLVWNYWYSCNNVSIQCHSCSTNLWRRFLYQQFRLIKWFVSFSVKRSFFPNCLWDKGCCTKNLTF